MNNQIINSMSLEISDIWKRRFELFDSLSAQERPRNDVFKSVAYKSLSIKERYILSFNPLAFFGGFIYYLFKGMTEKAGVLFSATAIWCALLAGVEYLLGIRIPLVFYWVIPSLLSAQLANFDYYCKLTQGESLWPDMPRWIYLRYGVTQMVLAASLICGGVVTFVSNHQYSTADARHSMQAIRINCGLDKVYVMPNELDLFGKQALCRNF
ncbi:MULTISPECIES: hypothetical protein [Vibrio]|uniref:DUF2628 domain-containing protein n=2 Tax=Vibrio TaxID=662 RepID=A0A7X4LN64_9VIBR|nr:MULTISPECIES: hypothetical protein [Vibrio]MBF8999062.1 hypothetical protein [Vibrio nitrifigilis]MZI95068.1 hypothetical protein [Vibrio eleionomae]